MIIDPEKPFYTIFNDFYLTILALASVVFAALWACFGFPGDAVYTEPKGEDPSVAWLWIDSVMEISFAIDIVINFFVQY